MVTCVLALVPYPYVYRRGGICRTTLACWPHSPRKMTLRTTENTAAVLRRRKEERRRHGAGMEDTPMGWLSKPRYVTCGAAGVLNNVHQRLLSRAANYELLV